MTAQALLWGPYVLPNRLLTPDEVRVEPTTIGSLVTAQAEMSRAVWRPAPGRKMAFLVWAGADVIGLLFLASPVINLGPRDAYLDLPTDPTKRGEALRQYADMSVCVSAQPIGWHWNLGKLCALLAPTLGDYFEARYGQPLLGITTTSLYGRGSQYNRVYKFLGYTKGYGHEHISDDEYRRMMGWLRLHNREVPSSRFGEGSNPRMRRIMEYRRQSGDAAVTVHHGNLRGIYYHAATPPAERPAVVEAWYSRWGRPRYERTKETHPPYGSGIDTAATNV